MWWALSPQPLLGSHVLKSLKEPSAPPFNMGLLLGHVSLRTSTDLWAQDPGMASPDLCTLKGFNWPSIPISSQAPGPLKPWWAFDPGPHSEGSSYPSGARDTFLSTAKRAPPGARSAHRVPKLSCAHRHPKWDLLHSFSPKPSPTELTPKKKASPRAISALWHHNKTKLLKGPSSLLEVLLISWSHLVTQLHLPTKQRNLPWWLLPWLVSACLYLQEVPALGVRYLPCAPCRCSSLGLQAGPPGAAASLSSFLSPVSEAIPAPSAL